MEDLRYLPCSCPVCRSHTPEELMSCENRVEKLALHNLHVTFEEIRRVKQSIWEGSLWELLEERCRAHPRMVDGMRAICDQSRWLERLDPVSKSTPFYLGPESVARPVVIRYGSRIGRIELKGDVLVTDSREEEVVAEGFDHVLRFKPPFGPYPPELAETSPLNAEVPEETDPVAMEEALSNLRTLIEANPGARFTLRLRSTEIKHEREQMEET